MSLQKCLSAVCSKFIETDVQPYVKMDRGDEVQFFCTAACFKEYERQNELFVEVTNPWKERPPKLYR